MNKLIKLPNKGKVIFVGDTHGDLDASEKVFKKYFKKDNILVFLGDYVDRGYYSKENADYLLKKREENPGRVELLIGNHETYSLSEFYPADFWEDIVNNPELYQKYNKSLLDLPFMAYSENGILAVHGAAPDIKSFEEVKEINYSQGDKRFNTATWGDFVDFDGDAFGKNGIGRPQFGKLYFERVMKALKMNVLIRAHQPDAPERLYDDKCITIFTSNAYGTERKVAIAPLDKKIITPEDIKIKSLDN